MGLYALSMLEKLEEAESMIRIRKTFVPDSTLHQRYRQHYTLFESLYPKLKDTFAQLSNLQPDTTLQKLTK